jgi:HD superfamily phosphohydrolase
VIDKKSLEAAKQMQKLYIYMYKEVYLHKSALISQRFLQKMVSMLIEIDNLDARELWMMNDKELMAHVYINPDERLKFLYECYKNRNLPSTGLVVRLKTREFKERIAGKNIRVVGEGREFFERFMKFAGPVELEKLESKIAEIIKIPTHKVVVVPTLTPWRFVPQDIPYHDDGKILSLKDTQKEYFESLRSEMSDYMAVRVCVVGDRGLIYKNWEKVMKVMRSNDGN